MRGIHWIGVALLLLAAPALAQDFDGEAELAALLAQSESVLGNPTWALNNSTYGADYASVEYSSTDFGATITLQTLVFPDGHNADFGDNGAATLASNLLASYEAAVPLANQDCDLGDDAGVLSYATEFGGYDYLARVVIAPRDAETVDVVVATFGKTQVTAQNTLLQALVPATAACDYPVTTALEDLQALGTEAFGTRDGWQTTEAYLRPNETAAISYTADEVGAAAQLQTLYYPDGVDEGTAAGVEYFDVLFSAYRDWEITDDCTTDDGARLVFAEGTYGTGDGALTMRQGLAPYDDNRLLLAFVAYPVGQDDQADAHIVALLPALEECL